MASERDFELLDEYVSNRLNGQEKTAFEQKLQADAALNKEYLFQKKITEGLRSARTAELKNILNNVPLSSIPSEGMSLTAQVGIWVLVAGLVGTGFYFFFNQDEASLAKQPITQESTQQPEVQPSAAEEPKADDKTDVADSPAPTSEEQTKTTSSKAAKPVVAEKQTQKTEEATTEKPALDVFDPSEDQEASTKAVTEGSKGSVSRTPSIIVETQLDKKYTFHYQFKESKLFLYGSFEKNLYEIMEFFADNKRTMFLYYKDNYYLLNEENEKVRALTPIADGELLKKLRDYRGK